MSRSILFARNLDRIYWRGLFHDKRKKLTVYVICRSVLLAGSRAGIYWMELFHDKRTNLKVYKRLPVDFIGMESWWHSLERNYSMNKRRGWPLRKALDRFYCNWFVMTFIERKLSQDKRTNLTVYQRFLVRFLSWSRDGIYWMCVLPR
jgi:hypothetical protein